MPPTLLLGEELENSRCDADMYSDGKLLKSLKGFSGYEQWEEVCLVCMACMCALYVCLVCMPYMYVCLVCMPYMYGKLLKSLKGFSGYEQWAEV